VDPAPDRYEPLPGLTKLPRWLIGRLSRRNRIVLGATGLLVAVGLGLAVAALVRTGDRQAREARDADRQRAAAATRALAEDQRPRRARLPGRVTEPVSPAAVAALERDITRDARSRVRADDIEGPIKATACTEIHSGRTATTAVFSCFTGSAGARLNYDIEVGYRFSAKVDTARGTAAWCKRNPRPLHPDTAAFRTLPLDPACRP